MDGPTAKATASWSKFMVTLQRDRANTLTSAADRNLLMLWSILLPRWETVATPRTFDVHGEREIVSGRMSRREPVVEWLCRLGVIGLCVPSLMEAAGADSVSDFFAGKTMSFVVGFPPGGGYDAYTRVLARHYGSFVPGHPSIFPSNMPGAGSLVAANYIYGKAVADGTVLAMFAASAALEPWLGKLEPWLGNKSALFDPAKFAGIGSMSQQVTYCGVWQSAGAARSFADMMTQDAVQETIFGGDDVPASHQGFASSLAIRARASSILRCTGAR
jgi:hypothetical protein